MVSGGAGSSAARARVSTGVAVDDDGAGGTPAGLPAEGVVLREGGGSTGFAAARFSGRSGGGTGGARGTTAAAGISARAAGGGTAGEDVAAAAGALEGLAGASFFARGTDSVLCVTFETAESAPPDFVHDTRIRSGIKTIANAAARNSPKCRGLDRATSSRAAASLATRGAMSGALISRSSASSGSS